MKVFVFHDWHCESYAVFDSKEKLNLFINDYQHRMIDLFNDPPREREDYSIIEDELNPNFNEWWNG